MTEPEPPRTPEEIATRVKELVSAALVSRNCPEPPSDAEVDELLASLVQAIGSLEPPMRITESRFDAVTRIMHYTLEGVPPAWAEPIVLAPPLEWHNDCRAWCSPAPLNFIAVESDEGGVSIGDVSENSGQFVSHRITDRALARQVAGLLLKWAETGTVEP